MSRPLMHSLSGVSPRSAPPHTPPTLPPRPRSPHTAAQAPPRAPTEGCLEPRRAPTEGFLGGSGAKEDSRRAPTEGCLGGSGAKEDSRTSPPRLRDSFLIGKRVEAERRFESRILAGWFEEGGCSSSARPASGPTPERGCRSRRRASRQADWPPDSGSTRP